MNPIWQAYLESKQAVIENDRVAHFGDIATELKQAQSDTVMMDLTHFGEIRFSGEDARAFLQGQLTCDVDKIDAQTVQFGSYCNPKGRMLATFLLWRCGQDYSMQLPSSLCETILKRLSMFVLRAKVNLSDDSRSWVRIGLVGKDAQVLIEEILDEKLEACHYHSVVHSKHVTVICFASARFELIVPLAKAPELWLQLSKCAVPVGAGCWDWFEIRSGFPQVLPATETLVVPQMANLDVINGVSFQKGCYPGQEIVARMQHLGTIKRRMYLANIATVCLVMAGDELFCAGKGGQSCGKIMNAARSPDGGYDVLAVIVVENAASGEIFWKSLNGPQLNMITLPYALD